MMIVQQKRAQAWRGLFELQLAFTLLCLGFFPAGKAVVDGFGSSFLIPFAAVYGGTILFVQHRMINWRCPECHKPFLRRKGTGYALLHRVRCGNCRRHRGTEI